MEIKVPSFASDKSKESLHSTNSKAGDTSVRLTEDQLSIESD